MIRAVPSTRNFFKKEKYANVYYYYRRFHPGCEVCKLATVLDNDC